MKKPMKICVIGLGSNVPPDLVKVARDIGRTLSKYDDFVLLTGACNGVSYEIVNEVKKQKPSVKVVGFSPGLDKLEHLNKYGYPSEHFDEIRFIGGGRQQRSLHMISECDKVLMIGGQMGSLIEFCISYRQGKSIMVYPWSNSASDERLTGLIRKFCFEMGCGRYKIETDISKLVSGLF